MTLQNGNPESVVPGLMAIGEAACVSVHGANRLGSNSLLDIIVFGRAAALRVAETIRPGGRRAALRQETTDRAIARLDRIRWSKGTTGAGAIRLSMQRTMQRHCAVFRDGPLLEQGSGTLDDAIAMMRDDLNVSDHSMIFNTELAETLELDNMLAQASASLRAAIGTASIQRCLCAVSICSRLRPCVSGTVMAMNTRPPVAARRRPGMHPHYPPRPPD